MAKRLESRGDVEEGGTARGTASTAADGGDHVYSLAPGAMCGGCEIERPLGAGAYGEVYLAIDPRGERCAIKRIQLTDAKDRKTRYRFLQEARILHHTSHPNVVACHGYGDEPDGALWMKLEYLRGANLRDLLHLRGTFPIEHVLRLGRQACQGLQELHRAGAVHRDIKPENLFVVEGVEVLKVLDFGLVKLSDSPIRTTGRIVLGTALYFAPDYLEGSGDGLDGPDPRWDVYSLGITLYEMLVGHPFVLALGMIPRSIIAAKMHLNHEIPELTEHGIPDWVAAPIMKALSRKPEARFPDAGSFGRALREVHEAWLAERTSGTSAPRTSSARMRLGHATTEPEVVSQLTRSLVSERDEASKPALSAPAVAATEPTTRALVAPMSVATEPSKPALVTAAAAWALVQQPALSLGPQGTERISVPPDWSAASTPSPAAPLPALASDETRAAKLTMPAAATRTEPLDRGDVREVTKAVPEVAEAQRADALPVDPVDRNAAEIAVWLKKGYMPPEVAAKLGLGGAGAAEAKSSPVEVGSRERPRSASVSSTAQPAPRSFSLPRMRTAVVGFVIAAVFAFVALGLARRRLTAEPAATAVAIPVAPTPASVAPSAPASVTPSAPASVVSASAAGVAPSPKRRPAWKNPAPLPKSSRADDLYPTPWDDPPAKASPSASGSAAKPAVTSMPGLPFGKQEN